MAVAIHTGPATHLDHLGVLAELLDIPLLLTDENQLGLCERFYPGIRASFIPLQELTLPFLSQYNLLFTCGKFWWEELHEFLPQMRFVLVPHGNSDKGFSESEYPRQDVQLIYGKQMYDQLQLSKIAHPTISGNYRRGYKSLPVTTKFDSGRKTVLFAPTWKVHELKSSFFEEGVRLLDDLLESYNVILKLHPLLADENPAAYYALLGHYEHVPQLLLLTDFPPVYPLFHHADLYLGDLSSVGYDFLSCDKPLFFLPWKGDERPLLYSAGIEISDVRCLERRYEENLSEKRRALYTYAFGDEIPISLLKERINEATQGLLPLSVAE